MLISLSELLKRSVKLYIQHFSKFIPYLLLALVPSLLINFASITVSGFSVLLDNPLLALGIYVIAVLLLLALSFWVYLAFLKLVIWKYIGRDVPSLWGNLRTVAGLIIPGILISFLYSLSFVGGFVLLVVPGIIFMIWFIFGTHALLVDGKHGIDALSFSKNLMRGRFGEVLVKILIPAIVFLLPVIILQQILIWIFGYGEAGAVILTDMRLLLAFLQMVISVIFWPLQAIFLAILYMELRKTPIAEAVPEEVPVEELK